MLKLRGKLLILLMFTSGCLQPTSGWQEARLGCALLWTEANSRDVDLACIGAKVKRVKGKNLQMQTISGRGLLSLWNGIVRIHS